jgi:hypothetical protein
LLFSNRQHYAAAALLRQLVEVEYLAWAFGTNNSDASNGDFQERCHSLAAFQSTWINGSA